MHTTVKFHCQFCGAKISAKDSLVGQSRPCPNCSSHVTVPTMRLPAVRPPVKTAANRAVAPPSPNSSQTFSQTQGFGMPMTPPKEGSEMIPIEMRMPGNLGGIKAQIDQPTSNTITSVFAGGVLVAIGAFLITMLGGKVRSA